MSFARNMLDLVNGAVGRWPTLPAQMPGKKGMADLDEVLRTPMDWDRMEQRGKALFASIDRDALAKTPVGEMLGTRRPGEAQAHEALSFVLSQDRRDLAVISMDERLALAEAMTHLPEDIRVSPVMSQAYFALVCSEPTDLHSEAMHMVRQNQGERIAEAPRLRGQNSIRWQNDLSDRERFLALKQASARLWDILAGPEAGKAPQVVPFNKPAEAGGLLPRAAWVLSRKAIMVNVNRAARLERMPQALEAVLHETVHAVQDHLATGFEQGLIKPGSTNYEKARLFALNSWRIKGMPTHARDMRDYLDQPAEREAHAAGRALAGGAVRRLSGYDPFPREETRGPDIPLIF